MGSRVVRPETVRLEISQGDWLLVKKRLTAGESRRIYARMIKTMAAGEKIEMDPMQVGRSQAIEYLLEWSLESELPIRNRSADDIGRALDAIDPSSFKEIIDAIQQHEAAMEAERAQEKNDQAGETKSPATSPSAA